MTSQQDVLRALEGLGAGWHSTREIRDALGLTPQYAPIADQLGGLTAHGTLLRRAERDAEGRETRLWQYARA